MKRVFGHKKPEVPPVNISDVGGEVDARITDLDVKIDKLEQELRKYRDQMKKTRGPAINSIKQRAMQTLKRKKMFEAQRDKLHAQSYNIEQTSFAIETSKDAITTVAAIKSAAVQLKTETQRINVAELENVQDDISDLMEDMNEIQDIMGRTYGIGDEIDEDELEAELEGLEDEWAEEEALGEKAEVAPSYLLPSTQDHVLPVIPSSTFDSSKMVRTTDEFGLPVASYST
ncbi:putative Snf7 family protein [Plasmopara halstedii]